jgi:regulator of sigma E protease
LQVYQTIRAMVHGSISVKEVSGPVGIMAVAYKVAQSGMMHLIWFLSIISANLAVMNFLPIPIVDGGLMTFLIIEKIKGSPISPRVQNITQAVGLALLLSVFLFATYQDVFNRLPFLFGR